MLLRFIYGIAWNSGQRLDNVNGTHLVLARGKLVLQKSSSTRTLAVTTVQVQDDALESDFNPHLVQT